MNKDNMTPEQALDFLARLRKAIDSGDVGYTGSDNVKNELYRKAILDDMDGVSSLLETIGAKTINLPTRGDILWIQEVVKQYQKHTNTVLLIQSVCLLALALAGIVKTLC